MILKPAPADVIEQYLGSLEAIGIDLKQHDLKLEEDNWEAPTLGAWGIGWQVMLDGLEISQFTYFQQCGGIDLDLVPAELTYGLERLTAFLQVKDSVYDIEWAPGFSYGDVRYKDELQYSVYNFEMADIATLWKLFDLHEGEATRLIQLYDPKSPEKKRFPLLPAYDQVLKCSNLFNTLDARGAISVTERVGVIQRVRKMASRRRAWVDQQRRARWPVTPTSMSRRGRRRRSLRRSRCESGRQMSLPFLLEIGTEEIPDWMIPTALENLRLSFEKLEIPHDSVRLDATPRRLVLRAEGLPARQPDSVERVLGSAQVGPAAGRRRIRPQAGHPARGHEGGVHAQGRVLHLPEEGAGPQHHRHSGRSAARRHPRALLPQDHVLDRQGRSALHPPHPLDCGAARRRHHSLRTGRRALRRADQRPSPPGRARDRRDHARITSGAWRDHGVILSAERAPQPDPLAEWPASASSPTTRCWKPWSTSPSAPRPSRAASIRSSWNCPKKC